MGCQFIVSRLRLTIPRLGKLHCYGTAKVSSDRLKWDDIDCYLFTRSIVCVREEQDRVYGEARKDRTRWKLKRCIRLERLRDAVMSHSFITFRSRKHTSRKVYIKFQSQSQAVVWLDLIHYLPTIYEVEGESLVKTMAKRVTYTHRSRIYYAHGAKSIASTASFALSSNSDYRQAFPVNRFAPPARKSEKYEWRSMTGISEWDDYEHPRLIV